MTKKSNTHSSSGSRSAKQYSKNTGPKPKYTATFAPLLMTPSATNREERTPEAWEKRKAYRASIGRNTAPPGGLAEQMSIYSREGFPASRSVTLDEEKERTTTATSGHLCWKPSLFSSPDGSSLKTLRDSLLGTTAWYSKQCALTWKEKVTKYNRSLYQLAPSVRRTGEIGSGSLLMTPTVTNIEGGEERISKRTAYRASIGRKYVAGGLAEQIKMLPTVRACEGNSSPNSKPRDSVQDVIEKAARKGETGQKTGLKLQPAFALWMMGFDTTWCDLTEEQMPKRDRVRKGGATRH